MNWKKIAPWNWFKDEERATAHVPERSAGGVEPFRSLRSEMDRMFEESLRSFFGNGPVGGRARSVVAPLLRPNVDISEGKKAYTVRAEVPGMGAEDLSVAVHGQTLTIRGEKRQEREDDEEEGYHCVERVYGMVQRVLSLPEDADAENVEAHFKNGVLKLRIPKKTASGSAGRRVEIQRG